MVQGWRQAAEDRGVIAVQQGHRRQRHRNMEALAASETRYGQQKRREWGSRLHSFAFPSGTRKEEANNNNIQGNTLFITLTVPITDASLEARWLAYRLAVAGYVIIIVSTLFGGWGETRSYDFACPPEPRGGGRTLSVVEDYSVGGGALCWWRWRRQKREVGANYEEL